jgi:hypothetical protein
MDHQREWSSSSIPLLPFLFVKGSPLSCSINDVLLCHEAAFLTDKFPMLVISDELCASAVCTSTRV